MNFVKVSIGVILALSVSRLVPHPPNFTSLLALSFYIPALFGFKLIPVVVIALLFTDLIIGLHSTMIFTTGSVIIIGLISNFFNRSLILRLFGALTGAIIFYLVTNFGVWLNGYYGYTAMGLVECYTLALPFFGYSFISTLLFSAAIESVYKLYQNKFLNNIQ